MNDNGKEAAAKKALRYVKNGMAVGLGTGSTSAIFIRLLGEKNKKKSLELKCIATSLKSEQLAKELELPLVGFEQMTQIDVAVDGADVIFGKLLIKGLGGGAIAREKAVDYRAKKFIVIADKSKVKDEFKGTVPVEAIPFCSEAVKRELLFMGAERAEFRLGEGGSKFITDNGNHMIDAYFPAIKNAKKLERELNNIPGVLENGIFTRNCKVILGGV